MPSSAALAARPARSLASVHPPISLNAMIMTGKFFEGNTGKVDPEPRWFDVIEPTDNPWREWFDMLRFPPHGPLDSWIERYIVEDICRAADKLRLTVTPATARVEAMWARFNHHHNRLDDNYKYRRKRWLVW